ncbi:TPA: phage tail fiber protein [Yersinia enterocolitica]
MAYVTNIKTVITYDLDNTTKIFTIPFEYLSRNFVVVTLIGQDRKILTNITDYTFSTSTQIITNSAWGNIQGYNQIEIRRQTSAQERIVDFQNGSVLRANDLNVSSIQSLHLAEEARDLVSDTIGADNEGNLDARGRRIVNLGDAVSDGDAVTLRQEKAWGESALNQANRSKVEADKSKTEADRSKVEADRSKVEADKSKTEADRSKVEADRSKVEADKAAASAGASKVSETNSKASEVSANASKNAAFISETTATQKATDAAVSATNAKASENRAILEASKLGNMNDLAAAIESVDPVTYKITFKGQLNLKSAGVNDLDAVTVKQLKEAGGTPVGVPMWIPSRAAQTDGYIFGDGQLLSRAMFPDWWGLIAAGKLPVVSDALWLSDKKYHGSYSTGDGSTTFRVPDYNGRVAGFDGAPFLRGDGFNRKTGEIIGDAIRNIYGRFSVYTTLGQDETEGVFTQGLSGLGGGNPASAAPNRAMYVFNASRQVPTDTENRPVTLTGVWVIRAFGSVVNSGNLDAAHMASQIADLMSRVEQLEKPAARPHKFIIMYMHGTQAVPATISSGYTNTWASPWPDREIACRAEVLYNGEWGEAGFASNAGTGSSSYGVKAFTRMNKIKLWTGNQGLLGVTAVAGGAWDITALITSIQFRIVVWTIDDQ